MVRVSAESFYNALPYPRRKALADATVKRPAIYSSYLFFKTLGNPQVVRQLPRDTFKSYINSSGSISFLTRIALAIRHFAFALFSLYDRFGHKFSELAHRKAAEPAPKQGLVKKDLDNSKDDVHLAHPFQRRHGPTFCNPPALRVETGYESDTDTDIDDFTDTDDDD